MLRRALLLRAPIRVIALLALAAGCEPPLPADAPPPGVTPPPPPSVTAPGPAPSAAPSAAPAAASYQGHGLSSVAPEILAKFAPVPLPSEVSRKIQALLDVRSPNPGQLTPDGKSLYFGW